MEASNHLPSPPGTSRREEKENRRIFAQMPRVSWSEENRIHSLSPSPLTNIRPSASYELPAKSILRKSSSFPFTDLHQEVEREVTPEPDTPTLNPKYLSGPVSRIIMMDACLKDLIQAYNILAARIRTAVLGAAEIDSAVPLFDPLRSNQDLFTDAVVRDLGRAMVNPSLPKESRPEVSLPSPRPSPSRKRHGMTEDEVRHARDLATTTHSVVKLLALIFASPQLCQIFSDDNLNSMLTALLVIPMAENLPTPNARKTCALTIWFVQVQRLPASVLAPAKDRIAYSLRRGIEGELGKEGKKGSISDGLKAVHDLCLYQPDIFIPSFVDLLPSVLSSLLAATLPLRVQACHALGGFVNGLLSLPHSSIHTRISEVVAAFLLAPSTPKKSGSESIIARTLRTLLGIQEPTHPANGPVWALVVVGCFVVLLGPRAYTDQQIYRIFYAQCNQVMRHKKSTIRAMGCLLWRCLAWVYVQPPLPPAPAETDEDEEEEVETLCHPDDGWPAKCRTEWWGLVQAVLEMRTGVSTIVCLLSAPHDGSGELVHSVLRILGNMVRKGGMVCGEAVQVVQRLVSTELSAAQWEDNDPTAILPTAFLDAYPGPLSVDYQNLSATVKPILDECVTVDGIRPLTSGELAHDAVFKGLVALWRDGLRAVIIEGDMDPPSEVLHIWDRVLRIRFGQVEELEADTNAFIRQLSGLLLDILVDKEIAPSPHQETDELPSPSSSPITPRQPPSTSRSNAALRIFLMRHLWRITRDVLPLELLHGICVPMLGHLKEHHTLLVPGLPGCPPGDDDALEQWGRLSAELLMGCQVGSVLTFMGATKIFKYDLKKVKRWVSHMRGVAWRYYAEKWMDMSEDWDEAVSVLLLPITAGNEPWTFSGEDIKVWEQLVTYTLDKALDNGAEPGPILEEIAAAIYERHTPTWTSATRIVDLIVSKLSIANLKETSALKLANQALISAYSAPGDNVITTWLIRSLTRIVEESPTSLAPCVLDQIQEGLGLWFADESSVFSAEEYEFDVLMSYQTILLVIQGLPRQWGTIDQFSTIIGAPFRVEARCPDVIIDTFNEFWGSAYADVSEPDGGWPAPIKAALRASRQRNETPPTTQGHRASEPTGSDSHSDQGPEQETIGETLRENPSTGDDKLAKTPRITAVDQPIQSHLRDTTTVCKSPSTPRKERRSHVSTPPRRHRTSSSPKTLHTLGPEPRSPLTDLRKKKNSSAPLYTPPTPKASDKENVGPKPLPDIFASVLGKRKVESTIEDSASYVKRRISSSRSLKTVRTPAVTGDSTSIESEGPVETAVGDSVTNTPSKKRKSEVFAGVVVPTMKEVMLRRRHSAPLKEMADSQPSGHQVFTSTTPLRKSRSTARMDVADHRDRDLEASPRKRIRTIRSGEPITHVVDFPVAGSDDSIVTVDPSVTRVQLSSDDDPIKLGRYTPRVLVSPVLSARRLNEERWDEEDVGSDDSVEPNSPTRDVIERRKKMGWPSAGRAAGGVRSDLVS